MAAADVAQELFLTNTAAVRAGGYLEAEPWPLLKVVQELGRGAATAVCANGYPVVVPWPSL